jgi:Lar family restriction alleviation protein
MTELKPCPFCGGEAKLISEYANAHYVECKNCWASVWRSCPTHEEAIEVWNRRANDD